MQPDRRLGGDDRGPDIDRGARTAGHPAPVDIDEAEKGLLHPLLRDRRNGQPFGRAAEPPRMGVRAEEPDLPVRAAKALEPVEHRLAVMQHGGRRAEPEPAHRGDAGIVPAPLGAVLHAEHVVGESGAEARRGVLGHRSHLLDAMDSKPLERSLHAGIFLPRPIFRCHASYFSRSCFLFFVVVLSGACIGCSNRARSAGVSRTRTRIASAVSSRAITSPWR